MNLVEWPSLEKIKTTGLGLNPLVFAICIKNEWMSTLLPSGWFEEDVVEVETNPEMSIETLMIIQIFFLLRSKNR